MACCEVSDSAGLDGDSTVAPFMYEPLRSSSSSSENNSSDESLDDDDFEAEKLANTNWYFIKQNYLHLLIGADVATVK
jgi:hypothetical protein